MLTTIDQMVRAAVVRAKLEEQVKRAGRLEP
jgi:hypothetical protein